MPAFFPLGLLGAVLHRSLLHASEPTTDAALIEKAATWPSSATASPAIPARSHGYSTNITPDRETGIGRYSFEEFDRAMRKG